MKRFHYRALFFRRRGILGAWVSAGVALGMTLGPLRAEPAPPGVNAADLYMAAAQVCDANGRKDICSPASSSMEFPGYEPYSDAWMKMETKSFAANGEAFELARKARSVGHADWPIEKAADGNVLLKYLNGCRNLTNELADAAVYLHLRGDDAEAVETLRDALHLADRVSDEPHKYAVSGLVTLGVRAVVCERVDTIFSRAQLTRDPADGRKIGVDSTNRLMKELLAAQMSAPEVTAAFSDIEEASHLKKARSTASRVNTELTMSVVSLACHIYKPNHGTWPTKMDDLKPYLPQWPVGPVFDGRTQVGYVLMRGGLPGGGDRPMVYSRVNADVPLWYRDAEPEYCSYSVTDPVTGKREWIEAGGQFRDVAGWAPADPKNVQPTTRPITPAG